MAAVQKRLQDLTMSSTIPVLIFYRYFCGIYHFLDEFGEWYGILFFYLGQRLYSKTLITGRTVRSAR